MKKILIALIVFIISIAPLSGCGKDNVKPIFPEDFLFAFEYGVTVDQMSGMNTYTNRIEKDLIYDGLASIEYIPSIEDLNTIYEKIEEFNILEIEKEMTSNELTTNEQIIVIEPNVKYKILIFMEGNEYIINGDITASEYLDIADAKNFTEFANFMVEFVTNTKEYKTLPEENGEYQ